MFCTMCEKTGYKNQMAKGCGTYKKNLIDRRVKNQEHILENARKTGQLNIVQSFSDIDKIYRKSAVPRPIYQNLSEHDKI